MNHGKSSLVNLGTIVGLPEESPLELEWVCPFSLETQLGPLIRSNKLRELAKLKQSRSASEYQTQFKALAYRAGFLSQTQKVQLYISGL